MSLHLMTLFTAHPAKLINLLALLFAFPGGWLLHATRRREQRAMASLAGAAPEQPQRRAHAGLGDLAHEPVFLHLRLCLHGDGAAGVVDQHAGLKSRHRLCGEQIRKRRLERRRFPHLAETAYSGNPAFTRY